MPNPKGAENQDCSKICGKMITKAMELLYSFISPGLNMCIFCCKNIFE
jgi:hypothetical protein